MSPKVTQIEFFELNGGCHRILRQIPGRKALLLFTWASDFCLEFVKKQTQASKMACFLAFVLLLFLLLSFFLSSPKVVGKGMANFLGKTEVAIEFYAKFWAEMHFEFFPKNFFLLRQENFHFLKTFSLYLERADGS